MPKTFNWEGLTIEFEAVRVDEKPMIHFIVFRDEKKLLRHTLHLEADRSTILLEGKFDFDNDEDLKTEIVNYLELWHLYIFDEGHELEEAPWDKLKT